MKVALVHDYLNEFGGGERVLWALSQMYPNAPIYTSFFSPKSAAWEKFKNKDIRTSWVHHIPFFSSKLHSPLRFLAPLIWGSFDFSDYDVVISSASWYVTKGFKKGKKTVEICYCHTPPRWLYGYKTSVEFQKYKIVKVFAAVVGHFMRMYDFACAQKVDYFIANSQNTAGRITKFYRRQSKVIYPPVELSPQSPDKRKDNKNNKDNKDYRKYYLVISRIVGGKGLDLAVSAANKKGFRLKIAGEAAGYSTEYKKLLAKAGKNVEFLGRVSDEELAGLYKGAKGFLALSQDEDFGITPVEAMSVGCGVIAFRGGGYKESVVEGKTGVFFDSPTTSSLIRAIEKFEKTRIDPEECKKQARKFSREVFEREIKSFVSKHAGIAGSRNH